MTAWITGIATLALLFIVIAVVQFGIIAIMFLAVALAFGISGLIAVVTWLFAQGRGVFSERRYGEHI